MMRVLHVIGAMDRGGAETTVMNLYRAVDRDVVQFDFLVHEERTCDFDEEISDLGGRLYRVPRFNGANLFHYARLCRKVFEEHPEHRIVHGHIGSSAAVYLSEAKRAGRFAIAHSHAQFFLPGFAGLAFRAVSWPTRFVADYFFACSPEAGKDRFGQRVVEGDRFSVLNGGIDLGRYACSASERQRAKRASGVRARRPFGAGEEPCVSARGVRAHTEGTSRRRLAACGARAARKRAARTSALFRAGRCGGFSRSS